MAAIDASLLRGVAPARLRLKACLNPAARSPSSTETKATRNRPSPSLAAAVAATTTRSRIRDVAGTGDAIVDHERAKHHGLHQRA